MLTNCGSKNNKKIAFFHKLNNRRVPYLCPHSTTNIILQQQTTNKMKKQVLAACALLMGVSAFAQTSTDDVTLNVRLNPIQTLVINPAQKIVNLDYVNKNDYANGVTVANTDHLTVYSTGGFQVKVKSAAATLQNTASGSTGTIASNSINIIAAAGTNAVSNGVYTPQTLTAEDKLIVSATTGGVDRNISVSYKGAGADIYLNNYVAGQTPTVYTTQVTYTIIAQ